MHLRHRAASRDPEAGNRRFTRDPSLVPEKRRCSLRADRTSYSGVHVADARRPAGQVPLLGPQPTSALPNATARGRARSGSREAQQQTRRRSEPRKDTIRSSDRACALLRRHVGGGQPAVDEERRPVHVGGLVAREEQRAVDDLARLREPAHRPVDPPPLERRGVVAEDAQQERRLDRARAERVDADALPRELHRELAAHREHGALRGAVGDLRRRRAEDRHERRDVDHRAAAALEQVRDPVLAAEVDALRVHVLDAIPGVCLGDEDRVVVGRRDARVVVEDVDAAESLGRRGVHRLHVVLARDVGAHGERRALGAERDGLLGEREVDVGDAHLRALSREHDRALAAHSAAGAGDHADLALEPSRHDRQPSVEMNTFLRSV